MNVLVTGGAGYIGSHVAWSCVDAGHQVTVLDDLRNGLPELVPPAARLVQTSLEDVDGVRRVLAEGHFDAAMHFAGSIVVPESIANPVAYYRNNTANSLTLIDALVQAGTRKLVFSSTAAVYGPSTKAWLSESDPAEPISPYGRSKLMTETMLADTAAAHDLSYVALRYFNVAGADPEGRTGQCTPNATHLIKLACQTALELRPELDIFGDDYATPDGTCIRDYIHVSDLAAAHLLALEHLRDGESGVMNCGYGRGVSVLEIVAAVERVSGRRLPVRRVDRRPGDAPAVVADCSKIRRLLPWTPRFEEIDAIVGAAYEWEKMLLRRSEQGPAKAGVGG